MQILNSTADTPDVKTIKNYVFEFFSEVTFSGSFYLVKILIDN